MVLTDPHILSCMKLQVLQGKIIRTEKGVGFMIYNMTSFDTCNQIPSGRKQLGVLLLENR
jgi:hypothetical protein